MLTGINLALMTAIATLNTVYLLRRRTRVVKSLLDAEARGLTT